MGTDNFDARIVAHHEAGHQVMAFELGLGVAGVELTADGGRSYDGLQFRSYDATFMSEGDCRHFRNKVLVLLAGGLAEKRLLELEGICTDVHLSAKDEFDLREHYEVFAGAEPPNTLGLDVLRREAEKVISQNWGSVRRLAEQLLQFGRLTQNQVKACLLSHGIVWDNAVGET